MIVIPTEKIEQYLDYPSMIAALQQIFLSDYQMPLRHHHFYQNEEGETNTLILMPVWNAQYLGMKEVTVAPGNAKKGMPSIFAQYILSNAQTGQPLALMDATILTAWRTACTSALAAKSLVRKNAENLLVIGGGKVASHLIQAHSTIHSYKRIQIWMRNSEKLQSFVKELTTKGIQVQAVDNLEKAVREADTISSATLSPTPIILGKWIKPGTHLDLIGAHKPDTREADNEAIQKSSVFVDSREGALHETGELAIPIANGLFQEKDVKADIVELVKGKHQGRNSEEEITLFKSAGLAVEDLAAALLVYNRYQNDHKS